MLFSKLIWFSLYKVERNNVRPLIRRVRACIIMCGIVIALGSEPLGIRITFPIISANLINNAWTTCDPDSSAAYENQTFVHLLYSPRRRENSKIVSPRQLNTRKRLKIYRAINLSNFLSDRQFDRRNINLLHSKY